MTEKEIQNILFKNVINICNSSEINKLGVVKEFTNKIFSFKNTLEKRTTYQVIDTLLRPTAMELIVFHEEKREEFHGNEFDYDTAFLLLVKSKITKILHKVEYGFSEKSDGLELEYLISNTERINKRTKSYFFSEYKEEQGSVFFAASYKALVNMLKKMGYTPLKKEEPSIDSETVASLVNKNRDGRLLNDFIPAFERINFKSSNKKNFQILIIKNIHALQEMARVHNKPKDNFCLIYMKDFLNFPKEIEAEALNILTKVLKRKHFERVL